MIDDWWLITVNWWLVTRQMSISSRCLDEQKSRWANEQMSNWVDEQKMRRIEEQMSRWADEQMSRWADEQIEQMSRWAEEQMNRWADKQMSRWVGELMQWPLEVTPGVKHIGAYNCPSYGHFYIQQDRFKLISLISGKICCQKDVIYVLHSLYLKKFQHSVARFLVATVLTDFTLCEKTHIFSRKGKSCRCIP